MSEIKVIQQTTAERKKEDEQNYQKFKGYFNNTDLRIKEIYRLCGFTNNRCSGARYIRKRLKEDGLDSDKRFQSIRKGEWLQKRKINGGIKNCIIK